MNGSVNENANANENVNVNANASGIVSDARRKGNGRSNVNERDGNARKKRRGNSKRLLKGRGRERGGTKNVARWRDARWNARDCFIKRGSTWS